MEWNFLHGQTEERIIKHEENNLDLDDGNSWLCSACTLPIFSTPFITHHTNTDGDGGDKQLFLHDDCANLSRKLMDHVFHPGQPLILTENHMSTQFSCRTCQEKCGGMFYQCPCQLDLLCTLQIKILHRSHNHRLIVIRSSASFVCGACGTQHEYDQGRHESTLSYLCHLCDFWIHPDCASLPNAIILHQKHPHSLFLTYELARASDSDGSSSMQAYTCAIYEGIVQKLGVYSCAKCPYYIHIKCAISETPSFKPVLIRDAKLADLLHFPLADEHTSAMCCIIENTSGGGGITGTKDEQHQSEGELFREELHEHLLILYDQVDDIDGDDHPGQSYHVCNACVQYISPPFYRCSQCPDFFLHSCCANLPSEIKSPAHEEHTAFLFPKSGISGFLCSGCESQCNGFAYSCKICEFNMDVVCALLPLSITHESHGRTHILSMSYPPDSLFSQWCNCCNDYLTWISYRCSNCQLFRLHAKCALLPTTIRLKFDEHPLKLTTAPTLSVTADDDHTVYSKEVQQICEICEEHIPEGPWYYCCNQCDQSLHIDCIQSVGPLFRTKFGVTIHIDCHDCPLTLVQRDTVYCYKCSYCQIPFGYDVEWLGYVYECSKCYFRIHDRCAEEMLDKKLRM